MVSDMARFMDKTLQEGYDIGRKEVAKEIFEEIEEIKKEYTSGDIDGNELYVRLHLLKKKYTA